MHAQVNKVVLAYSGGLDTSVILKWLQETYDCEVVTFTADLGQARAPFPPFSVVLHCTAAFGVAGSCCGLPGSRAICSSLLLGQLH